MDIKEKLAKLKELSISVTKKLEYNAKEMSENQLAVFNTVKNKQFGCKSRQVMKFASAFVGYNFPYDGDEETIPGSVHVPLDNINSHNYPIGFPVFILKGDRIGYNSKNKSTGNYLGIGPGISRIATEKEIDDLFEQIEKDPGKFFDLLNYHPYFKKIIGEK